MELQDTACINAFLVHREKAIKYTEAETARQKKVTELEEIYKVEIRPFESAVDDAMTAQEEAQEVVKSCVLKQVLLPPNSVICFDSGDQAPVQYGVVTSVQVRVCDTSNPSVMEGAVLIYYRVLTKKGHPARRYYERSACCRFALGESGLTFARPLPTAVPEGDAPALLYQRFRLTQRLQGGGSI